MQAVPQSYTDQFNAARRTGAVEISLIAQSNFNLPEWAEPTATASNQKSAYFAPANVVDGESSEPIKYWILGRGCKLGDGWCLLGSLSKHNPGWWSSTKSDGSGNFATAPWLEIAYAQAVDANFIRVVTTKVFSGVAGFTLKAWYQGDAGYTTIGSYTFGALEYSKTVYLGEVKLVTKIKVEVTSTKAATQNAKIVEVEPVLEWSPDSTPVSNFVKSYRINKSSGMNSPGKPAAPGVGANSLSIDFNRDIEDLSAPEENMMVILRQGFGTDLVEAGRFIIMEPPSETKDGWSCQAYSSLQLSKFQEMPDLIFNNRTTQEIVLYVLTGLGIPEDKITFSLSSNPVWTWYIVQGQSIDQILSTIADHFGVAIYQLEDGSVAVRSSYGSSVATLTDSYIEGLEVLPATVINAVVVHYSIVKKLAEDEVWSLDNSITVPASSSLTYIFPISKSPAIDLKTPRWTDKAAGVDAYVSISSWRCNGFYLNLTLTNSSGSAQVVPEGALSMRGKPLSLSAERVVEVKNQMSIRKIGRREFSTALYCASDSVAQGVANKMLSYLNKAATVYRVTLNRPMPHLQLRDVITINSNFFGITDEVVVTNIDLDHGTTSIECIDKEAVSG